MLISVSFVHISRCLVLKFNKKVKRAVNVFKSRVSFLNYFLEFAPYALTSNLSAERICACDYFRNSRSAFTSFSFTFTLENGSLRIGWHVRLR